MTSRKGITCIAALTLLALVCRAVIGANPAYDRTTVNVMTVEYSGDNAPLPDFDGDGTVGFGDFVKFAAKFGLSVGDEGFDAEYDLNGDGQIGFADFVTFAQSFGKEIPSDDRAVLVALYKATDGANWKNNTNWLSDRPLEEWHGVTVVNDRVWRLNLNSNNLSGSLPPELTGLSNLEMLEMGWNNITSISERPFAGLESLRLLQLNSNKITTLPDKVFTDLRNLTQLFLGGNDITAIPNGLFDGLKSLEVLSLDGCKIHTGYPKRPFAQLANLRKLFLTNTGLSTIPDEFFAGLANLEHLDLTDNPGSPLPLTFEFERIDHTTPSAPGPATVRARIRSGAPYSVLASVVVSNGSSTAPRLAINAGAAESQTFEVRQDAGAASSPAYLQAESVSSIPPGMLGLELQTRHLALFADSDNQAPIAKEAVPHLVLQIGGPRPALDIRPYFSEPDGEALTYSVATDSLNGETAADVTIVEATIALSPLKSGRDVWTITATDPRGLRASQEVGITVLQAPDDQTFDIDLVFLENTTRSREDTIRQAAERWERIIVGDLNDVPVRSDLPVCNFPVRVFAEEIDDLIVFVKFDAKEFKGLGGTCGLRDGSNLPLTGINRYHPSMDADHLYMITALHEIGHALGFPGAWDELGLLENPSSDDRVADTHFSGPLAIAAFDASGGLDYKGAKVPVQKDNSHWRSSVLKGELMNTWAGNAYPCCDTHGGNGGTLSAITVQSFADLGYVVDINQADRYSLPQLSAKPAVTSRTDVLSLDFSCHISERPIAVVGDNGQVVRTIEGPAHTQDASEAE